MSVTIKDVAAAAGTSISTVSKVINGHYSISEETAERVRAVMRELGYYPSASAQSFARGSTRTAVCFADLRPDTAFENPHLFEMISGLEEGLRARGYTLALRSTDTTEACEAAAELINRRGCDGLAIHASVMSRPLAALLTRTRFPHIVLGLPNFESQVCWIDINNVFSGMTAVSHLLDEGYRRIAFIGGSEHDMISAHRLEGVRQGLESAGRQLSESYIWLGESTRQEGRRMTLGLMAGKPAPDAIVCANNLIALGCVAALEELGLRIPQDAAVMTFDDYPYSRLTSPELTVVDIDVRDMGAQAAKLLTDCIRRPNLQTQTYATASNLLIRPSTHRAEHRGRGD